MGLREFLLLYDVNRCKGTTANQSIETLLTFSKCHNNIRDYKRTRTIAMRIMWYVGVWPPAANQTSHQRIMCSHCVRQCMSTGLKSHFGVLRAQNPIWKYPTTMTSRVWFWAPRCEGWPVEPNTRWDPLLIPFALTLLSRTPKIFWADLPLILVVCRPPPAAKVGSPSNRETCWSSRRTGAQSMSLEIPFQRDATVWSKRQRPLRSLRTFILIFFLIRLWAPWDGMGWS